MSERRKFKKILVCNRGEIAIRVFRACTELDIKTVAVYSHEDRFSLHRYKADEAYQSGEKGAPLQAYLDIDRILAIAEDIGVDAIHPGYGFLSERSDLRLKAEEKGIAFIGPSVDTLEVAGDKIKTRKLAAECGVPVIPGSVACSTIEEAEKEAEKVGFPVMLKSSYGGGGRGMRVVHTERELADAFEICRGEAIASFGKGELFVEKYISRPKHLEVQLLGDGTGNVVHLFERDCSVQRRHQKVIEYAPAIALNDEQREQLYDYSIKLGKALKLQAAATVEYLMSESGELYFIEINPRIQVEHTVTEVITGLDIVQSQIKITEGATLEELGLVQDKISYSGIAVQCRITTENPQNNFAPDYGKLLAYRSASGFGVRLDAGSAFTGAEITPFYDSMLVKVTAHGQNMDQTTRRMKRALSEFRVRGVSTNIAFLYNLLSHEDFLSGESRTSFLDENPEVFKTPQRKDRANKLLNFLSEVVVNDHPMMPECKRPDVTLRHSDSKELERILPEGVTKNDMPPRGWRDELLELGKKDFVEKVKSHQGLLITDTTFRDAHQSLFATRVRTQEMLKIAPYIARAADKLFSLEMWGGATFDVMLRFLGEDPWRRLELLRKAVPNILFQMLIRGDNVVGYQSYPENVVKTFIREASIAGIDIFRIFDALNDLDRMRTAIAAVGETKSLAEVCICFTGDLLSEEKAKGAGEKVTYDLDYYIGLALELEKEGADIIAIKDMAGLLRPYSAKVLVEALKKSVNLPIHFHTHDTSGVQTASYLMASQAGVDIVDCAFAAMSGTTSQPTLEGIVAALQNTERDTGLNLEKLTQISSYWERVRTYYIPFESDLKATTAEVYDHEIPGGQYSNLRRQAESIGVMDNWEELKRAYADVNELFGGIVKVTPSSKVVGDLAIFMVLNDLSITEVKERAREIDFPSSVIGFLKGNIGVPHFGFPEPFRTEALRAEVGEIVSAPALPDADIEEAMRTASELLEAPARIQDAISYLLYPAVFKDYAERKKQYGDLLNIPTPAFLYGPADGEEIAVDIEEGKRLYLSIIAVSEPAENGMRTVFFELNGQPRNIQVRDLSIVASVVEREKADPANPSHIASPLSGVLNALDVQRGQAVSAGDALFTLEAMKMQTVVRATRDGKVVRIILEPGDKLDVGDLVLELE